MARDSQVGMRHFVLVWWLLVISDTERRRDVSVSGVAVFLNALVVVKSTDGGGNVNMLRQLRMIDAR